jgi:uncharacterized membrane protein YgcG
MRVLIAAVLVAVAETAHAQKPLAVRQIGALEHVSADSISFKSIATALAMPGGRVMINDVIGRRVVILDSTLSRTTGAADTTGATANAYGSSWATLIRYRGDSALLIAPSTLSMFVLAPSGTTARVMALPRPSDAQLLGGAPGFDTRGRLVYAGSRGTGGILMLNLGMQLLQDGKPTDVMRILQQNSDGGIRVGKFQAESSVVVRVDLESRAVDTAAWVRIPRYTRAINVDDEGRVVSIATTPDPLPVTDQWVVLRDGTVAIMRGRDYHLDWIDLSGKRTSSPKLPFDWQKVSDARKTALIDSAATALQNILDDITASRLGGPARGNGGGSGAGSGRGGGGSDGRRPGQLAPLIAARPNLSDLPDYLPPFEERAVTSDMDDNVWVKTTQMVDNRPVYDVINRRGDLIDRVQLPRYRTIAGFGVGVIYMAVEDSTRAVRLERARLSPH